MGIEQELAAVKSAKDTVLTIGVFDGVHLGHQYLINRLLQEARQRQLVSGVITFRQHPEEVLFPDRKCPFLTSLPQRVALLNQLGVDMVVTLSFTPEVASLSATDFVRLLQKYLHMRGLVVGHDFSIGRQRQGNIENLKALGKEMNFTVTEVSARTINGEIVSSTNIRDALAAGDIKKVNRLIGRRFSLEGRVTSGDRRGTGLGFPTANLEVDPAQAIPANGVYATRAHISGKSYQSMTNIGVRPTFGGQSRTIEVYVLDYQGDLYGQQIVIDFIERLRAEQRFASQQQLKEQINKDVALGRSILKRAEKG